MYAIRSYYGIYATVMSVVGYVGLLDLGIGISLTKFVAEHYARSDYRRLNDMLSTALLLYVGLVFSFGWEPAVLLFPGYLKRRNNFV